MAEIVQPPTVGMFRTWHPRLLRRIPSSRNHIIGGSAGRRGVVNRFIRHLRIQAPNRGDGTVAETNEAPLDRMIDSCHPSGVARCWSTDRRGLWPQPRRGSARCRPRCRPGRRQTRASAGLLRPFVTARAGRTSVWSSSGSSVVSRGADLLATQAEVVHQVCVSAVTLCVAT